MIASSATLVTLQLLATVGLPGPVAPSVEVVCPPVTGTPVANDDELRSLWMRGTSFDDFFEAADARRGLWVANWAASEEIDPALSARVEATGERWYLLTVAVAGCSDSVNTVPWIARVAERAANLEMRIVDSDLGARVMERFRTPDDRGATPTFVLLDADFELAGCLVERPRSLRNHLLSNPDELGPMELYEWKMAWYEEDAGRSTLAETVAMIESAASGGMHCAPLEM